MAVFKVNIHCHWSKGAFEQYSAVSPSQDQDQDQDEDEEKEAADEADDME